MKRISTKNTFFLKKVFPLIWLGLVSFAILRGPKQGARTIAPLVLILPLGILFLVMRRFVWDLADEVYDCGDYLLVKKSGEEDRVDFSNIMNVSTTMMVNPPRITLTLVNAGRFGREVVFSPVRRFNLNPFAKDEVAADLMTRAYDARVRR